MGDLSGRTALVTGANSGIGFETARWLAKRGAQVVLGCRDPGRGQDACARIATETPNALVSLLELDLARQASVRQAAARMLELHPRLDMLCNNAGVMALERGLSEDGFELHLAVNHFGPFALTGLLLPALLASPRARVVTVTSLVHVGARIRFDDLYGERFYNRWQAYAQSKLANLLFAYELDRKLRAAGAALASLACHPGYSATNLQFVAPKAERRALSAAFFRVANGLFAQSADKGAWPTLYAATEPGLRGGECIGPDGPGEIWGAPKRVSTSRASRDPEDAARLWALSVERTGVDYAAISAAAHKP